MYPGRLDDRGRVKLPASFLQYFGALGETRFFVTSLDRRIAQIYTIPAWRETEKWLASFRADAKAARNVAFNAADLGAEADLDNQGRILFSTELRRELGIENQAVRLYAYRTRIEVLSDKIYQERRAEASATAIRHQIEFTREYENLGVRSPAWQELSPVIDEVKYQLEAGQITVIDETGGLSVYADPMIAKVIYNLMDNSLRHGQNVSRIRFSTRISADGCTLVYEDDGVGVPAENKEKIFHRMTRSNVGIGLFLVREILGITGITIAETGEPGRGVRFEISVPKG